MPSESQIVFIGNFLSKHGINPTYTEILANRLDKQGYNVLTSSSCRVSIVRFLRMILTTLACKQCTIVVDVYSGPLAFLYPFPVFLAAKLRHNRVILALHGGNLPRLPPLRMYFFRKLLRRADVTVTPSAYLANAFEEFSPKIIPNGVDVHRYVYKERKYIRPSFLFLRSFHELTRPTDAISAFKIVKEQFPDATLTMAGWDEDGTLAKCETLVSEYHLEHCVTFAGKLSKKQIFHLGKTHDIFLHTMAIDNMPVSVIEAMALGMCVIATRVGGLPFMITHRKNGFLVDAGDVEGIAACAIELLSDQDLAVRVSKNSRIHALANYDLETISCRWAALLSE